MESAGSSSTSSPASGSPNAKMQSKLPEGTKEQLQSLVQDTGSSSGSSSVSGSPSANVQSKLQGTTGKLVQKLEESDAAKLPVFAEEIEVAPNSGKADQMIIREKSTEPCVFKSINEIYNLPVVQSAVGTANACYTRIKKSNCLCNLYLSGVETAVNVVSVATWPCAQCLLFTPVGIMDAIAYKGITFVENKVPVLTLPTDQLIDETKQYIEKATRPCRRTIQKYVGGAIVALLPDDVILAQPARPGNGNDVTTGNDIPEDEPLPAPENN